MTADTQTHGHPTPKTYALIAVVLTTVTLVEYVIFQLDVGSAILVPVLTVLSVGKFALVCMFYMHLKFDHHVYTRLILTGILLMVGIMFALLTLFFVAHPFNPGG